MHHASLYSAILTFLFLFAGCEEPRPSAELFEEPVLTPNLDQEREAIRAVIIAETDAFRERDAVKKVSYCTDPYKTVQDNVLEDYIFSRTVGHEEAIVLLEGYLSDPGNWLNSEVIRTDWSINIDPNANMAWATFKATAIFGDVRYATEEIRVLEKIDGEWKIALLSTMGQRVQ